MNKNLKKLLVIILITVLLWLYGTSMYQTFSCPEMTQTELFLEIPNNFILNFKKC